MSANGPCVTVATGGVGESGSSRQVVHQVEAKIQKLMLLKTTESSLCPDHGAVASLLVDGKLAASGVITDVGDSIQATADPGAWVVGIVHTFPLFNDIRCIRLGELEFELRKCDLVT